jgi:hypothetical protein
VNADRDDNARQRHGPHPNPDFLPLFHAAKGLVSPKASADASVNQAASMPRPGKISCIPYYARAPQIVSSGRVVSFAEAALQAQGPTTRIGAGFSPIGVSGFVKARDKAGVRHPKHRIFYCLSQEKESSPCPRFSHAGFGRSGARISPPSDDRLLVGIRHYFERLQGRNGPRFRGNHLTGWGVCIRGDVPPGRAVFCATPEAGMPLLKAC